jgi:hypothetical protein
VISPDDTESVLDDPGANAIKANFRERFGGDNRGEPLVISGKVKVQVLSFSPQQMDLTALRRVPEERISGVTGVPAIVAGLGAGLDRSTFANFGEAREAGFFVAPAIIRLAHAGDLKQEVFGPVLHVATWRADAFNTLLHEIEASGYGLTFGLETRIETRVQAVARSAPAGNIYINRNTIGAIVGSQPFGGFGRSGTGPKAGGPDYLRRFVREITVTINTASSGGDAGLLSLEED